MLSANTKGMEGRKLLKISSKFGQPTTIQLSDDDVKKENFLNVIKNLDPHYQDQPFIKLFSPHIKDLQFDASTFKTEVFKKCFKGFPDDKMMTGLEDKSHKKERLSSFISKIKKSSKIITEEEFLKNYFGTEYNFEYVQNFDKPSSVIKSGNSNFKWTEVDDVGIKGNLPGINKPWLYVGGSKSAFPWHLEDGNVRSLNIMINGAEGASKIWYGIRNEDILRVEDILKQTQEAAECSAFFRHKRHWLNLRHFYERGIPIYKCVQEPGDIVITNSFHQGWNSGFTMNYAINFFTGTQLEYSRMNNGSHCDSICEYPSKSNFLNSVYDSKNFKFKCLIQHCTFKPFGTTNGLKKHMGEIHSANIGSRTIIANCPICDKPLSQPDVHLQRHLQNFIVYCVLCRNHYNNKKELKEHFKDDHKDKEDMKCKNCSYVAKKFDDCFDDHYCHKK